MCRSVGRIAGEYISRPGLAAWVPVVVAVVWSYSRRRLPRRIFNVETLIYYIYVYYIRSETACACNKQFL